MKYIKAWWPTLAIILIASGIAWHFCYNQSYADFWHKQIDRTKTFVSGTAGEPEQYRIVQYAMLLGSSILQGETAAHWVYWLPHWIFLSAVFLSLWRYYKAWGIRERWIALACAAYFVIYAHSKSGYASGTYFEVALYALGLLAIWKDNWKAVLALSFFGSFNRETIALLPLVGLLYAKTDERRAKYIVCLGAALAVQAGLRLVWPQTHLVPCRNGLSQGWRLAITNLNGVDLLWTLGFLGFLLPAWRRLPKQHWPLYILAGAYLALHLFAGNTTEVRLLLVPVCLALIPGVFSGVTDVRTGGPQEA